MPRHRRPPDPLGLALQQWSTALQSWSAMAEFAFAMQRAAIRQARLARSVAAWTAPPRGRRR
jgi:hypothetical protein